MMYLSLSYWGELNTATSKVLAHTGGVSLYSGKGGNYDSHGGLDDLLKIYKKRGLAHEKLSRKKLKERFPQFSAPKNTTALYQPDFGVLFADVAICVEINQRVSALAPSSKARNRHRHAIDATLRGTRAVKFDFHRSRWRELMNRAEAQGEWRRVLRWWPVRHDDRVVVRLGNKERVVGRSCIVAPGRVADSTAKKWFNLHTHDRDARDGVLLQAERK